MGWRNVWLEQTWSVAGHLGFYEGEKVVAEEWLAAKLQELGLEESADLSLMEPGDLHFERTPDWELDHFERSFPRKLRLENMDVDVQYYPETQEILLTKTGEVRKAPLTRSKLPAWAANVQFVFEIKAGLWL